MTKRVIWLSQANDVAAAIKCGLRAEDVMVASTYEARTALEAKRIPYRTGMEYVDYARYDDSICKHDELFNEWLQSVRRVDLVRSEYIDILHTCMSTWYMEAARATAWAKMLMEQECPEEIVLPYRLNAEVGGWQFTENSINLENLALWLFANAKGCRIQKLPRFKKRMTMSRLVSQARNVVMAARNLFKWDADAVMPERIGIDAPAVLLVAESWHLMQHIHGLVTEIEEVGLKTMTVMWRPDAAHPVSLLLAPIYGDWENSTIARRLARTLRHVPSTIEATLSSAPLDDVVIRQLIEIKYGALLRSDIPQSARWMEIAEQLLARCSPSMIILPDDSYNLHAAVALAARNRGIPTLCVQHGNISSMNVAFIRPNADWHVVWGSQCKKALLAEYPTITPGSVVSLGRAQRVSEDYDRSLARAKMNIPQDARVAVFFSVGGPMSLTEMERGRLYERLIEAFMQTAVLLIIKPHPSQDMRYPQAVTAACSPDKCRCMTKASARMLISAADVVISHAHTSMHLEAMAIGRPLIYLEDCQPIGRHELCNSEAALTVGRADDVPAAISRLLDNPEMLNNMRVAQGAFLKEWDIPWTTECKRQWTRLILDIAQRQSPRNGE